MTHWSLSPKKKMRKIACLLVRLCDTLHPIEYTTSFREFERESVYVVFYQSWLKLSLTHIVVEHVCVCVCVRATRTMEQPKIGVASSQHNARKNQPLDG
jgi:hypothetical protein